MNANLVSRLRILAIAAAIPLLGALSTTVAAAKAPSTAPAPPCAGTVSGYGTSPAGGRLVYGGGPVQTCPAVYLDFWDWPAATQDPYSVEVQQNLERFLGHVGGSDWNRVATQYCEAVRSGRSGCASAASFVGNPNPIWRGAAATWSDQANAVDESAAGIAAEAARAAVHFGITDALDAQVVVALPPPGVVPAPPSYHSDVTVPGIGTVPYTALMNQEASDFAYTADTGDMTPLVEAHELVETETDPLGTGWTAKWGGEVADLCESSALQPVLLNGMEFPLKPFWSNVDDGCVDAGQVTVP